MADRFLREVKRMHQLRADINEMTPEEADELIRGLGDDAAEDWIFAARDAQLPPSDLSWCWVLLAGGVARATESVLAVAEPSARACKMRKRIDAPIAADCDHDRSEGWRRTVASCGLRRRQRARS